MTTDLATLRSRVRRFVERRSWGRYHTPKNLSMAIAVEAAELMEPFQWHDNHASESVKNDPDLRGTVQEELADIVIYCLSLAIRLDIDLGAAVSQKLDENERRFDEEGTARFVEDLNGWVAEAPDDSHGGHQ